MRKKYRKWIAFICCFGAMTLQANEVTMSRCSTPVSPSPVIEESPSIEECPAIEKSPVIDSCGCPSYNPDRPILQFRASYFFPFSQVVRDLIRTGGADYSLQATIPVWKELNVWTGIDYFSRGGKMIGFNESVHLTIVPLTVGLKYIYPVHQYCGIYGGAGARCYFVEMVNRLPLLYHATHRWAAGGIVEIGNLFYITDHFIVDVFSSFSFSWVDGVDGLPPNATSLNVNVGGWNIGAGAGYKF